ncbi:uncharacterized protein FA14DRAFT_27247 [Meira miltonrushii]|uniref:Thioesterase/thiol ester dehydrase-isomerase n=1 Tax=Meira miltonrushii TaxID=1280837 RepID=A0A316VSI3_9BASI|nr:uncharacterized protein FA14DRAFT_27247 [Meira miltonrushii]PWN38465.1 hypothetical protein FA14DRAFT_27247 [Meira miltonrushii]
MSTSSNEQSSKRASHISPIDRLVALKRVNQASSSESVQKFESVQKPFPLGNANSIAYGGFCVSLAIVSAYQSLQKSQLSKLNIYSVQASFLGPTKLDASVRLEVTTLRETRTFSTRLVLVKQDQGHKDKNTGIPVLRSTLAFLIDFVATKGDRTLEGMAYAEQPAYKVTDHSALPTIQERYLEEVKAGRLEKSVMDAVNDVTKDIRPLYEQKLTPEGLMWDNLGGIASDNATKQDDLKTTNKVTYDWLRHLQENSISNQGGPDILYPPCERASAACFYGLVLDGYLSFLPLVFSHRYLYDADACSSLDLSLRFHVDDLRGGLWNLREMRTIAGEDERTYSQSRLWQKTSDRSSTSGGKDEFKLIATMTQSSVMRGFEKDKSHI